jgi:Flp pilus assembly pilin Flp
MKILRVIPRWLSNFRDDEAGPTAVEYAVMLGLIVAACVGSVSALSVATKDSFDASAAAIHAGFGN